MLERFPHWNQRMAHSAMAVFTFMQSRGQFEPPKLLSTDDVKSCGPENETDPLPAVPQVRHSLSPQVQRRPVIGAPASSCRG